MKNEDLFYAMNFLDEDLIEEAKKLGDKAVVSSIEPKKKARNKAKIMPLVASWAAAAAVLVIGGIILFSAHAASSDNTKSMNSGSRVRREESAGNAGEERVEAVGVDDLGGGTASWNTTVADNGSDSYYADDPVEAIDSEDLISDASLDIFDEPVYFTVNDMRFVFVDELDADEAESRRGEQIGITSECDNHEYDGLEVYEDTFNEDMVMVFFPDEGVYGIAFVAER